MKPKDAVHVKALEHTRLADPLGATRGLLGGLKDHEHVSWQAVCQDALGAAGALSPAASATLHNLSTLAVSLHSMGALPQPET